MQSEYGRPFILHEMDNDLKLLDVINDPDALDQFLYFSTNSSTAQQNSFEAAPGEFYNYENGQLLKSSTENPWNFAPSASVSDAFFDPSLGSPATQITNVPVPTLAPHSGAASQVQSLPSGVLAINSAGSYPSQNVVQFQQTRTIPEQFPGAIVTDNSLQQASPANRVITNFSVASSAGGNSVILPNSVGATLAGNGGQMLMNVQPHPVVQNGGVRIQYVQVRNQHQTMAPQVQTNTLNSVQLPQNGIQLSHGLPGSINLQGARILIQTGNQPSSGNRTGQQINLQQMQVSAANLVGITQQGTMLQQGTVLQQGNMLQQGKTLQQGTVLQHGTVLRQGTMLQQGTVLQQGTMLQRGAQFQQARLPAGTIMSRTNNLVDSNLNLSSGGQMVVQRGSGQNVVFQTLQQSQQQHGISLPQHQTIGTHDGKLPDGLVVQIGGQVYRFEQTHQATGGVAVPAKQGAVYPQSQGGAEYGEGSGVSHDPVKMLQQNVQLQQMLIGNQINVLQLLQQQQQQRQQQTTGGGIITQDALQTTYAPTSASKNFLMVGQQFVGSQGATQTGGSGMMVVAPHQATALGPMEGASGGLCSVSIRPAFAGPVLHPTLEKTVADTSSESHTWILPTVRPGSASSVAPSVPQTSLQFIQPKPTPTSVAVLRGVTSGISSFGSAIPSQGMNVLRPGTNSSVQQLNLRPPTSSSLATVQSMAPSLLGNQQALKSGTLQGPQNVQPIVNQSVAHAGQSQTVTTVQLSAEQQNLLTKIQSQMKTLLELPKRNPDEERYLQMLIAGQQRIINQGVAQYLQQQKVNNAAAASGAAGSQVSVALPVISATAGAFVGASTTCQGNSGESLATGVTSVTSTLATVTSTSSARVQLSLPSGLPNSGAPVKAEDLFQAFPYLKEKLEAQLAKMPPEQRQWFAKNQSVVFAKLQHHHRLLQERDKLQQQQLQQQQPPQPPKHPTSAQQVPTDTTVPPPPPETTATRVIRSLHLTRAQKFHLYLQKDQKRATHPESTKPFENFKDVIRSLVPYHVFQTREPAAKDVAAVEEAFEEKSRELLDRKDSMLRKYRHLLWEEAMRPQLTSEMVLLERAFHSDEKTLLLDEKRQAEEDPDSFVPRPVIKRLKLDEDIKKEEDECKDEDVADDTKIDFETHDQDDFLKAVKTEDSSTHSSPSNTAPKSPPLDTSVSRSSSIQCYKSLQIKLEKLDGTEPDSSKRWQVSHDRSQHSLNLHISARNVSRTDPNNGAMNASKNRQVDTWFSSSDATEVPTTSSAGLFPSFTEDDTAVATLLNAEQLTLCGFPTDSVKVAPPCAADVDLTEREQRFDPDDSVNTIGESMNSNSGDALYTNQEMSFDMGGMVDAEEEEEEGEDDELMQGTIDSLMADLTQFNRDLSSTSWMSGEAKSDALNGIVRRTENQSASSKYGSPLQASTSSLQEDCENSSLQHEIQCAINSIIRLQQPWSENATGSTDARDDVPRTDDDESSLDAAVNSILL